MFLSVLIPVSAKTDVAGLSIVFNFSVSVFRFTPIPRANPEKLPPMVVPSANMPAIFLPSIRTSFGHLICEVKS